MPFIINNISAALDENEDKVIRRALQRLGSHKDRVVRSSIHKVSLDARKRKEIHYVYSVYVCLDDEKLERSLCSRNKDLSPVAQSGFDPVISTNKVHR